MIDIRHLTVKAEGRTIMEDFFLRVAAGQTALLSGPSGSGKTTLIKAVMGFIEPTGGEITVDGLTMDPHHVWQARQRMAYVPQEIDLVGGTVRDVLTRPLGYRASSHLVWDEGKTGELLSEFHLDGAILGQDVRSLSGGERKRIALVSALLLERPILILDEVTTELDRRRRDIIHAYLKKRGDLTMLVASHDEAFLEYADVVRECILPTPILSETETRG